MPPSIRTELRCAAHPRFAFQRLKPSSFSTTSKGTCRIPQPRRRRAGSDCGDRVWRTWARCREVAAPFLLREWSFTTTSSWPRSTASGADSLELDYDAGLVKSLAEIAKEQGDAARGAVLFVDLGCNRLSPGRRPGRPCRAEPDGGSVRARTHHRRDAVAKSADQKDSPHWKSRPTNDTRGTGAGRRKASRLAIS